MSILLRRFAHLNKCSQIPLLSRYHPRQIQNQPQTQAQNLTPFLPNVHLPQFTIIASHVSPIEMIVWIMTIGILIALFCWLGWIVIYYAFRFIKEKIDDYHVGKRVRFNDRRREQEIENATRLFGKIEKEIGKGVKTLWDGLTKNEAWMKREFGERTALIRESLNAHDGAGESRRYGYYEGMIFNDRERGMYMDGDGTSENCPALR